MIEVVNKLFQPLALRTSSGEGLHLPPRGRAEVATREVSEEMRRAERRGFITLRPLAPAEAPEESAPNKASKTKGAEAGRKEN